jgi:hypothetical protein
MSEQLRFEGMPEPPQMEEFEPIQMYDGGTNRQIALECATHLYASKGQLPYDVKDILYLADKFVAWLDRE